MNRSEIEQTIYSELGRALLVKTGYNQDFIRVKFEYEDEFRAIQLKKPVLFGDLLAKVKKDYGPNVLIRYLISKENQVFQIIKDQNDLDSAVKLAERCSNNPTLVIRIVPCSSDDVAPSSITKIFDRGYISPENQKLLNPLKNKQQGGQHLSRSSVSLLNVIKQEEVPSFASSSSFHSQHSSQSLRSSSSSNFSKNSVPQNHRSYPNAKSKGVYSGKWIKGRLIGSGAFGRVFMCYYVESGRECAVKEVQVFSRNSQHSSKEVKALLQEINILKEIIDHPNIVQYYDCIDDGAVVSILMEYMPGGSVENQIKQYGPLTEKNTASYSRQVLLGLEYLHLKNIVHRDIKGANILRDHEGNVKLGDFGASKRLQTISNSVMQSQTGTAYYMSPEVLNGNGYGRRTDIWSFGCTVVEMLTGHPPWSNLEGLAAIYKIVAANEPGYTLPENSSKQVKDFLSRCFMRNPSDRPTSSQLLAHSFVKLAHFFDSDIITASEHL